MPDSTSSRECRRWSMRSVPGQSDQIQATGRCERQRSTASRDAPTVWPDQSGCRGLPADRAAADIGHAGAVSCASGHQAIAGARWCGRGQDFPCAPARLSRRRSAGRRRTAAHYRGNEAGIERPVAAAKRTARRTARRGVLPASAARPMVAPVESYEIALLVNPCQPAVGHAAPDQLSAVVHPFNRHRCI